MPIAKQRIFVAADTLDVAGLERVGAQNAELIRTIADITKADRESKKSGE